MCIRKYSAGGKRSIFLVNMVCLANQQAETLRKALPFEVAMICGDQNVDNWKIENWQNVLNKNEVIVMTAQVLVNAIKHKFINLEQVDVIVFDECHHGQHEGKNHPYREIMKRFNDIPHARNNIRVMGLSGMLIGKNNKTKPGTVGRDLKELEAIFESTIITVNTESDLADVMNNSTNAKDLFVEFNTKLFAGSTYSIVNDVSRDLRMTVQRLNVINSENPTKIDPKTLRPTGPVIVKNLISMFNDFEYQVSDVGYYGGYLSLRATCVQLELISRGESLKFHTLVMECLATVKSCINRMECELNFKDDKITSMKMLEHSTDKIRELISLLRIKFNDVNRERDLQCLIFVERRLTAKTLYHYLKMFAQCDVNFPIIPDFMVGVNNVLPESIEAIISKSFNDEALENFRKKETNCIVATNVLEEGIDLQMCNLVIAYDAPNGYRSYVQAKGRARVKNSTYAVLLPKNEIELFKQKVRVWHEIDEELKQQLLLKTIDRNAPSADSIQHAQREAWQPFLTAISQSVLNNMNSVM